jgi:hypothetical protein
MAADRVREHSRRGAGPERGDEDPVIRGEWLAAQTAISGLVLFLLLAWTRLDIPENSASLGISAALLALALVRFGVRRPVSLPQRQLRDFSEYALLFFGTGFLGVITSYPAAALTRGFDDPALERVDRALHFDWLSWYGEVAHHPALQVLGSLAYAGIYVSPLLLLGCFAWTQRRAQAREFLVTFWVAGMLTLLIFPMMPAEGPLAFLWRGPVPYMPTSALYAEHLIPALRAHQVTDIDMRALRGLVSAPSFHTVSALLYIAAGWPIRRLRWTITPINVAMLLAIPIEGTHYLADMIAGMLVALAAIALVKGTLHWLGQRRARWSGGLSDTRGYA